MAVDGDCIRAAVLAAPVEACRSRGLDTHKTLAFLGECSNRLNHPENLIETAAHLEFLRQCTKTSDDALFSFQAGFEHDLSKLGIFGRSFLSAPTLLEALQCAVGGIKYFQKNSTIVLEKRNRKCVVHFEYDNRDPERTFALDLTVGFICNLIRQSTSSVDKNLKLYFPSASATRINRVGCSESIEVIKSDIGRIEFSGALLCSPMVFHDWARHRCYSQYMNSQGDELADRSIAQDVRTMITATFDHMQPSLAAIASLFGVSERRLQRRLQTEGVTFREALETSRRDAANLYLKSGQSVTETALMLGYQHPGNFTSAYRRWFGRAPSAVLNSD